MSYIESGVWLLKRWDRAKGVDHYAVGISGSWVLQLRRVDPAIVQLLPTGVAIGSWQPGDGWESVGKAGNPGAALERIRRARGAEFRLLNNNCEHFARAVVFGKAESHQLQVIGLLLGLGLVLVLSRG